jgi:hypothetical protein
VTRRTARSYSTSASEERGCDLAGRQATDGPLLRLDVDDAPAGQQLLELRVRAVGDDGDTFAVPRDELGGVRTRQALRVDQLPERDELLVEHPLNSMWAVTSSGDRAVIGGASVLPRPKVVEKTTFSTSFSHREKARSRGSASSSSATDGQYCEKPSAFLRPSNAVVAGDVTRTM